LGGGGGEVTSKFSSLIQLSSSPELVGRVGWQGWALLVRRGGQGDN
jgi:hypothetical protein